MQPPDRPFRPSKHTVGNRGEALAAEYVTHKGAHVVYRNLRLGPLEIDIAARWGSEWVLIEVKTLTAQTADASPELGLTPAKQAALRRAAAAFEHAGYNPEGLPLRLDLAAVLLLPGGAYHLRYYPDAVQPG
ncbi:MAG: YraN family protein [Bacteroidia bacterium]|nr:YraN family protein [Bacteroidia bacterium]